MCVCVCVCVIQSNHRQNNIKKLEKNLTKSYKIK